MGLLSLVFPPTRALSGESIVTSGLPSRRVLARGMESEDIYPRETGLFSDILFQEYVVSKLGNFTRPADQGLADPYKMNQAVSLSCVIAAGFRCSPAPMVILAALVVCWAFAESILDVRTLLEGGKVPAVKTADQWQIRLENLPDLLARLDSDRKNDPNGLSYSDYIQGLLFLENRHTKIMGSLDMIEQTLQRSLGWDGFRLDHCVAGAGGSIDVLANERWFLTAERTFCYD